MVVSFKTAIFGLILFGYTYYGLSTLIFHCTSSHTRSIRSNLSKRGLRNIQGFRIARIASGDAQLNLQKSSRVKSCRVLDLL